MLVLVLESISISISISRAERLCKQPSKESINCTSTSKNNIENFKPNILPPMFLYSLEVVRATDFEIAKTVEMAIVQILDENCKFCKTDSRNVFVLDK